MKTPIKDLLKFVQDEVEVDESMSLQADYMDGADEDLSASMRGMSISGEVPGDILEELKHEQGRERMYGLDRLIRYAPEESLKTIVEKIFAAKDKRLVYIKRYTHEIIGVISISNIFTYVTS